MWLGPIIFFWLILFANTPTPTHANNFYGIQPLKPMVERNKTTIHLPGGAKLATESDETEYFLTDHLQSTRLVVAGNNSVSKPTDYTSFGDTPANTTEIANQYTGMTYEPETATYDYHARAYDPGVARFTGLDRQREDASPYVYVGNNPIAFVDPSGGGKMPFILASGIKRGTSKYSITATGLFDLEVGDLHLKPNFKKVFRTDVFFTYSTRFDGKREVSEVSDLFSYVRNILKTPDGDHNYSNKIFWVVTEKNEKIMDDIKLASDQLAHMRSITDRDDFARDAVILDLSKDGDAYIPIMEQLKTLNGKKPRVIIEKGDYSYINERSRKLKIKVIGKTNVRGMWEYISPKSTAQTGEASGLVRQPITTSSPTTEAGDLFRPSVTVSPSTTLTPTITEPTVVSSHSGVHGIGPMRHQNTLSAHRRGTFYQRPGTNLPQTQAQTTESSVIHTYFPPGF